MVQPEMLLASVFAITVLPVPGLSSINIWPFANKAVSINCICVRLPRITVSILSVSF